MLARLRRRGGRHELAIRSLHAITPTREGIFDAGDVPNDARLPLAQQTVKDNICDSPPHTPPHRCLYGRHLGYRREDVDKMKKDNSSEKRLARFVPINRSGSRCRCRSSNDPYSILEIKPVASKRPRANLEGSLLADPFVRTVHKMIICGSLFVRGGSKSPPKVIIRNTR